jgi:hypothetical protein
MSTPKVFILSRGKIMQCAVKEPVNIEWDRKGVPGKLTFDVLNDENLNFWEGDAVRFDYGETKMFYGFVFSKKRSDNRIISVTAYDQLRYFKNKETYTYVGKTAGALLKMIISDFKLQGGLIDDTKYTIASRSEDNQDLFTIMDNASQITTMNTGKLYVLYDNYGKIYYRDISNMKLDLLVDAQTAQSFSYTSSIDENTYNQVKLIKEDKENKKREIYIAKDTSKQNEWGILQITDTIQDGENGQVKADAMLKLYNQKTRKLDINGVFGDVRVRGGSIVGVLLNLGDLSVANYMLVEKVKHSFYESNHIMDLTVAGGEFVA